MAFVGVLFFVGSASAQDFDIEVFVESALNEHEVPGAALSVVLGNTVLIERGFGRISVLDTQRVEAFHLFHAASISKIFTAMGILKLFKDRNLSLDAPLSEVAPEVDLAGDAEKVISVRHLLTHRSGLRDIRDYQWGRGHSPNALAKYVASVLFTRPRFEPGSDFRYSSLGYDLLGSVIEQVSRQYFSDYMRQNILRSFGLSDARFNYPAVSESLRVVPHGKRFFFGKIYSRSTYPFSFAHAPSSTLQLSAADASRFFLGLNAILNGNMGIPLDKETLLSMWEDSGSELVGMGWWLGDFDGRRIAYHFGSDKGFNAVLVYFPEQRLGIVLLMNADFAEDLRREIVFGVAERLFERWVD